MRISEMTIVLAIAASTVPLLAQKATRTITDRAVRVEGIVNAPVREVWRVFHDI